MFYIIRICSPWDGRRKYKFPINRRKFNPAVLSSNRQQILFTWCVRLGIDTNWILAFHALTFRPTLMRYWLSICLPSCYRYEWKSIKNLFNHSDFKMKLHMKLTLSIFSFQCYSRRFFSSFNSYTYTWNRISVM